MRRIKKTVLIALLSAISLCAVWREDGLADSSLLLVTSDFQPYVFCDKDATTGIELPNKGIDIDILSELFRRLDQPYSIKCLPWKRVVTMVKDGEAAGGFPSFKTPEREAFAMFLDDPLHLSQYNLFVKRGNEFPFKSIDDLAGKRIGIERAHSVSPAFHAAANAGKFRVEEGSSPDQNLKMLLAGRLDGYINNRDVVLYKAKQLGMEKQVVCLPKPLSQSNPSYLMISKAAPVADRQRLIQRLNLVLHQMWEDGTVKRITKKYIP